MAAKPPQRINWWHQTLIEWLLVNPDSKLREAAEFFNVSQSWLSTIMRSDIFEARFEARLQEHRTLISRTTAERLQGMTDMALELMEDELETGELSFGQVKDTAEMMLKASGFLAPKSRAAINITQFGGGQVAVSAGAVHPDVLNTARERAKTLEQNQLPTKVETLDSDSPDTKELTLHAMPAT